MQIRNGRVCKVGRKFTEIDETSQDNEESEESPLEDHVDSDWLDNEEDFGGKQEEVEHDHEEVEEMLFEESVIFFGSVGVDENDAEEEVEAKGLEELEDPVFP